MNPATDRAAAIAWARKMLADPKACLLDFETTGPNRFTDEAVQVAVVDMSGRVLINWRIKPRNPIPAEATAIHGISNEDVEDCPIFPAILPMLAEALHGKTVIIYNREFDTNILFGELARMGEPEPAAWMDRVDWRCCMLAWSAYVGVPSEYGDGYKWQKLPGAKHGAVNDCLATLEVIRTMAEATN